MDDVLDSGPGGKDRWTSDEVELQTQALGDPLDHVNSRIGLASFDLRDVSRTQPHAATQFLSVDVQGEPSIQTGSGERQPDRGHRRSPPRGAL
ncbi:MAG TPA: hypothetical protein VFN41_15285, partial [Candidatus Limnocylindrales bacterium]|nr:hypothetical protein [Candidatus Limnocylindrales bacterium]